MNQRTRTFIRTKFPVSVPIYDWMLSVRSNFRPPSLEKVFSEIYLNNGWEDSESVSGAGSTMARTAVIRRELSMLLENIQAKSLLDAACGDFNWMRHVPLGLIEYVGVDIVPQLVERNRQAYANRHRSFVNADITLDDLPRVDVILCRDCLIHLSFQHGRAAVENFKRSRSTFMLATTHTTVTKNVDVSSGAWRNLNLQLAPYNFPAPCAAIAENPEAGKVLALWRLSDV
jgi:hypothetical protein